MNRWCLLAITLTAGSLPGAGCLPPECRPAAEPTLLVGSGVDAFTPLTDPPELLLVYGPQGGVHFDISLRGTGLSLDGIWDITLRGVVGDLVVAETRPQVEASCDTDVPAEDIAGLRLIVLDDVRPADLVDPMDVHVDVTDADGGAVSAVVQGVTVTFP